jgi:branched-chain amino acid transport system substrate-binding protein
MTSRARAVCLVGVVGLFVSLLTACSSSGSSAPSGGSDRGSTESSAAHSTANGSSIKLGMIMNSFYTPLAPPGAMAAISAINAAGGVNGHPLELDVCDNRQDANAAAACARKYADDSSIIATVGDNNSFGDSSNPPLATAKVAGIGVNPLGSGDYASPRIFPFSNGGLLYLGATKFMLQDLHASRLGMVITGTPTAAALPKLIDSMVMKPAGTKLADVGTIPPTATDVSSQAAALTKTNGQLVALTEDVSERYITASRQQGYAGPFAVSEALADAKLLQKDVSSSDLDQLYGTTYFDKTSPGYQHFLADMGKYQPNVHPSDLSTIAWLAVEIFAKVAATLPTITRQSVWDALNRQTDLTTEGLTQPLNFTVPGTALGGTAPRLISAAQIIYIDRYQDGKWVPNSTPQKPIPVFGSS